MSVLISLEVFMLGLILEFFLWGGLYSLGGVRVVLRLVVVGSLISLLVIVSRVSFRGGLRLRLGW